MGTFHFIKDEFSSWQQRTCVLWKKLSLLDKVLFCVFFATLFVIVIPSILNDFFYTGIYLTDISVGFSILLLFSCVFWLGYFSSHGENGEFKKITQSKKTHIFSSVTKAQKKSKKKKMFLKLSNKFVKPKEFLMVYDSLYKKSASHFRKLTKKLSPEFILSLGIYYHTKKNFESHRNDIEFYIKINDMPFLLPSIPNDKKKPCSYHRMMKNMEEAKKKLCQKASTIPMGEHKVITDQTRKRH